MLAKLFEHSEFFGSAEKCRRLAIGCRTCGNEQSYENKKKSNNYEIVIIKIYSYFQKGLLLHFYFFYNSYFI